ncbi:hypothetical protein G6O67_001115 [Ophiocordyceps sinensis]|uniref:Uncharacterized protein n=1 Tax=Ophiocordyceps sinensis TaxID=72228 RepID=A0A8H4PWP9_9HYPO|nr:hypothetical protein G6O67_001115 [Ophiocordyceps sinensis]
MTKTKPSIVGTRTWTLAVGSGWRPFAALSCVAAMGFQSATPMADNAMSSARPGGGRWKLSLTLGQVPAAAETRRQGPARADKRRETPRGGVLSVPRHQGSTGQHWH